MVLRIPVNAALAKWKALARQQKAPADARLYKQFLAEIKAEGDGVYGFTISTDSVDRDDDTLAVDGWKLDNYLKNPVVLWAHMYSGLPIGQAVEVVKAASLTARVRFVPAETYALAGTVRALVDGGFLRATSVGFRPLKWVWNDERGGYDFVEQELLEFSIVPVPANPEALIAAATAGVDLAPLKAWAEGVLEDLPGVGSEPAPAPAPVKSEQTPAPIVCAGFVPTQEQARAALTAALSEAAGATVRRALGRLD